MLRSVSRDERKSAIKELVDSGDPRAVETIASAFDAWGEDVRFDAVVAYGSMRACSRPIQPLISVLHDKSYKVREAAAEALGAVGDTRAVGPLREMLQDPLVIGEVLGALAKLGWQPQNDSDRLQCALHARNWNELKNLGSIAVDPLIDKVNRNQQYIAEHDRDTTGGDYLKQLREENTKTITVLGQIRDSRAFRFLVSALGTRGDSYWHVRIDAALALRNMGDAAVDGLIPCLRDPDSSVRSGAIEGLSEIGGMQAVHALIELSKDSCLKPLVRGEAIEALGRLKPAEAVQPIIEMLVDKEWSVRLHAVQSLAYIGDTRACDRLLVALMDDNESVRKVAARSLAHFPGSSVVQPLVEFIQRNKITEARCASDALQTILEKAAPNLSIEDLQKVAHLTQKSELWYASPGCNTGERETEAFATLKQLARQELIRRGLEA